MFWVRFYTGSSQTKKVQEEGPLSCDSIFRKHLPKNQARTLAFSKLLKIDVHCWGGRKSDVRRNLGAQNACLRSLLSCHAAISSKTENFAHAKCYLHICSVLNIKMDEQDIGDPSDAFVWPSNLVDCHPWNFRFQAEVNFEYLSLNENISGLIICFFAHQSW